MKRGTRAAKRLGSVDYGSLERVLEQAGDKIMDVCSDSPCPADCISNSANMLHRVANEALTKGIPSAVKSAKDIIDDVVKSGCSKLPKECIPSCKEAVSGVGHFLSWNLSKLLRHRQLGIIVAPHEKCKKGFEKIIVKSKLNKRVHICRLAKGYRKYEPEAHKAPYRRLREFGPGIEHRQIVKKETWRRKKAERILTAED